MINISSANITTAENISDINLIGTSQQLLLQAKTHEPTDSFVEVIKNIPQESLSQQLNNDKKAFG